MTLLLLIRHAAVPQLGERLYGRSPGIALSAVGREQAVRLADRISPLRIAAIYASPMERCRQTAAAIAAGRRLRPRVLRSLDEVDYGSWTGRTFRALRGTRLWRRLQASPSSFRFPDGETLAEVQRRVVAALHAIALRHPRQTVAVVTHGDPVRLALAHYAGVHIDLFQRLEVAPASVSAVALDGGAPRVVRVNDTGALEDLGPRRRMRG